MSLVRPIALLYPRLMTTENNNDRDYDVVVWGASGFTGRLVVEYLKNQYGVGQDLRWAVAARNAEKLGGVLDELSFGESRPDVIIADSKDEASLDAMCKQTKVVLTTVGPYALYGDELVAACVANGTHYCDLAGEVQWIRRMIDQHQAAAEKSGARIVNCCGFDSIPSDLGVQFLQEKAVEQQGSPCSPVELVVRAMKGGGSGGTIASALNALEESQRDREVARIMVQPYSLNPEGEREGPDGRDQRGMAYSELAGVWTAPFVMAVINMRVVRRSNALMDYPYGRDFEYNESSLCGDGATGWLKAATMTTAMGGFMTAAAIGFTREHLVRKLVPKPGEGPNAQERENGYYNLRIFGKLDDGSVMQARVTGDRDPGYGSTSKMLAESAICLARDDLAVGGGCWTPASAMGKTLRERLVANAGLTFDIV